MVRPIFLSSACCSPICSIRATGRANSDANMRSANQAQPRQSSHESRLISLTNLIRAIALARVTASAKSASQNLPGSGSRKFPISYPVLASSFALGRDQAPVSRQAWTIGAADKNVVIEVPNRCLVCNSIVEHIIGLTVRVEIAHCYKVPTVRKTWAKGAANKARSRQIPDCRLVGGRVEKQVIGPAVSIEVCHTDHFPVSWKSWTKGAADKNVVIEIPNHCLVCARIVKKVIGMAIAI